MQGRSSVGRIGESAAAEHLLRSGHLLAGRNVRLGRDEIDIISLSPENILVFSEVRTRTSDMFGSPEETVSTKKTSAMRRAVLRYLNSGKAPRHKDVRIDFISILLRDGKASLRHYMNVG